MSYHHDLAHQLRRRGCTEKAVADVLHTVDEAVTDTGNSPAEEFGSPEDYAAQFSGPRKRTPGQKALGVFGLFGVVCMVIYGIWPQWFGITTPVLEQFAGLIALLVLLAIGCIPGAYFDNRLPRAYKQQLQDSGVRSVESPD
ncbi:hypothetical protein [Corynebacterium doosanense]|uniref:Uncharacterized protein n=1 Tax=Corynebacterium doosanense CAU 212 = DSM 45436 TaxID=558173 RepID=A0A097IJN9_9CORY|nr:hypothetical protein [Corynebacterium doosanense]AIT62372.1 hypothetical protein CDOO_13315 [Corynebacterium doosanense CAU 212 = DSM 45436]